MKRNKKEGKKDYVALPQNYEKVMLIELQANARDGAPLFVRYGGSGMEPLLKANYDKVCVRPVDSTFKPKALDVLALDIDSCCRFRRFLREEGDVYVVRGDSCRYEERVEPTAVVGILEEVERADGSSVMCGSDAWKKRSSQTTKHRTRVNSIKNLFDGRRGRYWGAGYFIVLLLCMWMPLGGIPLPDNLILGLRPDHFFHASIYCFCAYFLWLLCGRRREPKAWIMIIWVISIVVGVITEFGQKLLPYRSFDINDLLANAIGATFGWFVFYALTASRKSQN